jgi:hypothetical protein
LASRKALTDYTGVIVNENGHAGLLIRSYTRPMAQVYQ